MALVLLVAFVALRPALAGNIRWTSDSLFYQAQTFEIRGASQNAGLHRAFSASKVSVLSRTGLRGRSTWAWIEYSARFYRRRWLMPAIAAALYPLSGERALVYAAALGYAAFALLLFALVRRRFSSGVSLLVTVACMLLPPVRMYGGFPLTDSWGLALETGSLLAAILALERGGRWIAVWGAAMLALSLTRDATAVLVIATAWFWFRFRTHRSAWVFLVGLAASIPAPALFRAPLVQQLSWLLSDYHIPHTATWGFVAGHLPLDLAHLAADDLAYPASLGLPYVAYAVAAMLVAAVIYLLRASPRREPIFVLTRAAIPGAIATVALSAAYSGMRVELVFIPIVAVALAFAVERLQVARGERVAALHRDGAALRQPAADVARSS